MPEPYEVSYTRTGRNGKRERNVIGVLCPTALSHHMRLAQPIFINMGDVQVDWNKPQSAGYVAAFDKGQH